VMRRLREKEARAHTSGTCLQMDYQR